ncbi:MAG: hypothetical protein IKL80_00260 [Clostridia bacterium]|nr:hypothetical protein [Clostridia bacterium]
MTVQEFIDENALKNFTAGDLAREITGCYISDLLSLAMSRVSPGDVWITVQGNVNIAAVAALTEPACILLVDGRTPDETAKQKAQEQGITMLGTELTAYEAACRLYEQSR